MKLWLISQNENNSWDTYDSMVVAAENEEVAKEILPPHTEWEKQWSAWASGPENVAVEYLGEAREGTSAGIILASFNAG